MYFLLDELEFHFLTVLFWAKYSIPKNFKCQAVTNCDRLALEITLKLIGKMY